MRRNIRTIRICVAVASGSLPLRVVAQSAEPTPQNVFAFVLYDGGLTTYKPPHRGYLVLTDSAIEYHECFDFPCTKTKGKLYADTAAVTIPYRALQGVDESTERHGASVGAKIALGAFAGERREEMVTLAFENATGAEAPIFETQEHESARLLAQIRFRLRRIAAASGQ